MARPAFLFKYLRRQAIFKFFLCFLNNKMAPSEKKQEDPSADAAVYLLFPAVAGKPERINKIWV